jgi:hypothetical protein
MAACKEQEKKEPITPEATTAAGSFIKPPIKGADVPYQEYDVDAANGDTIIYPSGSIILFPPNAFVDEAGKPVTGNVQVKYREFRDPVDFFLAGIPMQYDSAGTAYQFESSGMLDIRAFKDGKPVFVNQAAKPEINLASSSKSDKHSLYFLDTVQKKWINKGSMVITERRESKNVKQASPAVVDIDLPEPVKPLKADNKSPVLKIEIDPSSFREFAIYKGLKFQVDERKTPFNVKDSEEEWNNLELLKGSEIGTYMAKFSNARKSATYAVKPVFEGADYDNAMIAFEKEYALYQKQSAVRAIRDKGLREKYAKDSIRNDQVIAENKRIESLNAIIAKNNIEIEKQNEIIAKKNIEIEKQNAKTVKENKEILRRKAEYAKKKLQIEKENKIMEKQNEIMKRENEIMEKEKSKIIAKAMERAKVKTALSDVYRSFEIDGFGFWNCDVATRQKTFYVLATYKDEKGNVLDFDYVTIINRTNNSMLQILTNDLLIVPGTDNMILAVYKNQLAYVSYSAFKVLNITAETKEQTFVMKFVEEPNLNYEYIRSVLKQ